MYCLKFSCLGSVALQSWKLSSLSSNIYTTDISVYISLRGRYTQRRETGTFKPEPIHPNLGLCCRMCHAFSAPVFSTDCGGFRYHHPSHYTYSSQVSMRLLHSSVWKDPYDLSQPSLSRLFSSHFTAFWYTRGMQSRGCLTRTSSR